MILSRPFATPRRSAICCLLACLAACSGSPDAKSLAPVIVPPVPVVTTVTAVPVTQTIEVGGTATLAAEVRDQLGAMMLGQTVTWSTSDSAIASVVSMSGVVTGTGVGTALLTASAAGKTALATVVVVPIPVVSVTVSGQTTPLAIGLSASFAASLKDRNGAVLTGRTVSWSSSAPSVAIVDSTGKASALAVGTTIITAVSEGVSGSATLLVTATGGLPVPTISAMTPAALVPGTSITLDGSAFDTLTSRNTVTIRGISARVTRASATQLTVTVPCASSGAADVQVTASGRVGPKFTSNLQAAQRALSVGEARVETGLPCVELVGASGAARYIVAVVNMATSQNSFGEFEFAGNSPTAAAPVIVPPTPSMINRTSALDEQARRDRAHEDILERNRAIYAEGRALMRSQPRASRAALPAALPAVGDQRDFFYTLTVGCRDTTAKMRVKALYVGSKAIIWEDTTNVILAAKNATLDGYYQRMGSIFDQDQYDVVKSTFGDPLRRDAVTDNDGHINMVFTQRLTGTNAAAFVTSCDQYPTTTFAASNYGQVLYAGAPSVEGSNLNSTKYVDGWFNFMARTIVHEAKHIASHSARFANGAPNLEQSWLEEGTARHAEEIWVRDYLHKVAWKGNSGFGSASTNGIYCDFHGESAACNAADALRRPSYGMRRHFNELKDKLDEPWNWSIYGDGQAQTGSVFYETAWSLVRYAIDRYAVSDAAFLSALTNSTATGLENLSQIAGVSSTELLGMWSLALYADDYPGLASPSADLRFPTWNLRSIYGALNQDPTWGSRFTTPFPIQPVQLGFGSFSSERRDTRGGATAYFQISGTASGPQLVNVRAIGGGNPSSNLRIAIARLQ